MIDDFFDDDIIQDNKDADVRRFLSGDHAKTKELSDIINQTRKLALQEDIKDEKLEKENIYSESFESENEKESKTSSRSETLEKGIEKESDSIKKNVSSSGMSARRVSRSSDSTGAAGSTLNEHSEVSHSSSEQKTETEHRLSTQVSKSSTESRRGSAQVSRSSSDSRHSTQVSRSSSDSRHSTQVSRSDVFTEGSADRSHRTSHDELTYIEKTSHSFESEDAVGLSRDAGDSDEKENVGWIKWYVHKYALHVERKTEEREKKIEMAKQEREEKERERIKKIENENTVKKWLQQKRVEDQKKCREKNREWEKKEKELEEEQKRKERELERAKEAYEEWHQQKKEEEEEEKRRCHRREDEETQAKRDRRARTERAFSDWLAAHPYRPPTRTSYAYTGGRRVAYYDRDRPPSPSMVNIMPWRYK